MDMTQARTNVISEGEFRSMPEDDQNEYIIMTQADRPADDCVCDHCGREIAHGDHIAMGSWADREEVWCADCWAITIEEMRGWLADLTLPDGYEASSLDACEIISMVTTGYDGGIAQFLADGN